MATRGSIVKPEADLSSEATGVAGRERGRVGRRRSPRVKGPLAVGIRLINPMLGLLCLGLGLLLIASVY